MAISHEKDLSYEGEKKLTLYLNMVNLTVKLYHLSVQIKALKCHDHPARIDASS